MNQPSCVQSNVSLKQYNTWKVGGAAEYFALPESLQDIKDCLAWAFKNSIKVTPLGDGSNVLVSDKGIHGLVVCLTQYSGTTSKEEDGRIKIQCLAGTSKAEALKVFLKYKLTPALFLTGLPGNISGGVAMNAGVGEQRVPREFCEIVDWVDVLRIDSGVVERVAGSDIKWSYRNSEGWQPGVIVEVGMSWPLSEPKADIMTEIKKATRNRIMKQPINLPTCGSVFRNPKPHSSGALIEQAGLKGYSIGGAQVSTKHANFITTKPGSKASDVDELIKYIQEKILQKNNIQLHTEVIYLGDWSY